MATWAVVHLIHVRAPHQHIPRLIIRGVPEDKSVDWDLVESAGYSFGEFGIPRANHYITCVSPTESPSDLVGAVRRILRDPDSYDVPVVDYEELLRIATSPL